jgi:serine O-acetyltransferase
VLLSAGAKILGNIKIGDGAQICAGSVVLKEVPPHTMVAGVPAKVVGKPSCAQPALEMNHRVECDGSLFDAE